MNIKKLITTIDTHTEGGPTRTVLSGIPVLRGLTVKDKMEHFKKNFDDLRKLLLHEPRGHQGIFGAVITDPSDSRAHMGVFFLTHSGYLNMCVHSAIGAATACLEIGIIEKPDPGNCVILETPTGLVSLLPCYSGNRLNSVTIQTNPAFVFIAESELDMGFKTPLKIALVFSEVFFVLLDVTQIRICIDQQRIPELIDIGFKIIEAANRQFDIHHPENPDICQVELAMLYEDIDGKRAKSAVISRTGSLDRSPCGAGTGAKLAYLHVMNRLKLEELYVNESVFGTKFEGKAIKAVRVGSFKGILPQISGSAYITGWHQFILEEKDPLKTGL